MMRHSMPVLLKDGYKVGHPFQYPEKTTLVYSNFTPRTSRVPGAVGVINFGEQYFVQEYLVDQFEENFFLRGRDRVLAAYERRIKHYLGPLPSVKHIADLHDLGYLPICMKSLPEGTLVPLGVPVLTLYNTKEEFGWLTNMLETLLSNVLWMPITSATTAFEFRKIFNSYALMTGADLNFVKWQGHDFSMRGMAGIEAAMLSGAAHLLSFTGTDSIPALDFLEEYYDANVEEELVGGSVPATEHSVMSMGGDKNELETIRHLITEVYPKGIVSIVADTWDFWKVITEYAPALKKEILARDGKVVFRPDSGDPCNIVCGDPNGRTDHEKAGAIAMLARTFDVTYTKMGHMQLDSHVGLIYGDGINRDRQTEMLHRLKARNYASTNVVLGIGSFSYQYVTRDTYGLAMKATYGEVEGVGRAIYKDPKTDSGLKKSARGLLRVDRDDHGKLFLRENVSWQEEEGGELRTIFQDGNPWNLTDLKSIRGRIDANFSMK